MSELFMLAVGLFVGVCIGIAVGHSMASRYIEKLHGD